MLRRPTGLAPILAACPAPGVTGELAGSATMPFRKVTTPGGSATDIPDVSTAPPNLAGTRTDSFTASRSEPLTGDSPPFPG